MAAGEDVSVRSQLELLQAASHELDGPTLRVLAEQEAEELGWCPGRGVPADQAEQRAAALRSTGDGEPGTRTPTPRRPAPTWSTRRGGRPGSARPLPPGHHPILPFLFTSGSRAIAVAAIVVGACTAADRWPAGPAPARHRRRRRPSDYGLGGLFNTIVG
jgi:hypothetical protein